jgi:DNA-binding PadR family transcriptional regulator
MQEKGFIDSRQEARPAPQVGIPRRMYRISGLGQRVMAAYEAARTVMSVDLMAAR